MKPCLYRHFSKHGDLLYVGISLSVLKRTADHKRTSHWFKHVTKIEIEHFETIEIARVAEIKAINEERPWHNIAGAHSVPHYEVPVDDVVLAYKNGDNWVITAEDGKNYICSDERFRKHYDSEPVD